jgi:PAS domain S-box-containing protein
VISFRKASLWDEHRYLIFSIIAAFGLQSAIIGYVLVENRRRRIAERSLAENEERMAFTAASTNTGLWQFESEDTPIWATKHCRAILGLADDVPVSLNTLRNSIHPDDRLALVRGIREAASTGRPIDSEFRVVVASGETRWIAMKGFPRRNMNVGLYHINGILSDVTAMKNAEGEAELQRTEHGDCSPHATIGSRRIVGGYRSRAQSTTHGDPVQRRNGTGSPRSKSNRPGNDAGDCLGHH